MEILNLLLPVLRRPRRRSPRCRRHLVEIRRLFRRRYKLSQMQLSVLQCPQSLLRRQWILNMKLVR